jgi:hypothetical protein
MPQVGVTVACAGFLFHCYSLANVYRVVDLASEMFKPDAGNWVPHDKLFHISSPHDERYKACP